MLQAKKKDLLKECLKIVDASKITADISLPNKVNLLHQGRRLIIKTISKFNPQKAKELAKKYLRKTRLFTKPDKKEIAQERKLTRKFIKKVKGKFDQQIDGFCRILNSLIWNRKKKDKLASFIDPDARFGKTSPELEDNFCGYKAHIVEDESEIITSVDTLAGNEIEGIRLKTLLEKEEEKEIKSSGLAGDTIYDTGDNYQLLRQKKIRPYISFHRRNRRTWQDFRLNRKKNTLRCPQGNLSIGRIPQQEGFLYYFSTTDCLRCPVKSTCIKTTEDRARVFVKAGYLFSDSQNRYRKRALKLRKMIERKFAEAQKWHGLSRARYRGKWKVAIQVIMTFLVINAKRIVRLLKEKLSLPSLQVALATGYG
ncbi:MAG: transposase [Candidatus Omnitrophica bacterium]|nr:transposase [Candidatus Omnitrophota bacterium]